MASTAVEVAPLPSLTVLGLALPGLPHAAWAPIWALPRLTAETPGCPRSVHACPDKLVKLME